MGPKATLRLGDDKKYFRCPVTVLARLSGFVNKYALSCMLYICCLCVMLFEITAVGDPSH
jgi:hypothetical protein